MFDQSAQYDQALGRLYDHSKPVWVDLHELYRQGFGQPDSPPSLLVKAKGLALDQRAPGVLHAWVRSQQGSWVGLVSYLVQASPPFGRLRLRSLVPKAALRPRQPEEHVDDEPF